MDQPPTPRSKEATMFHCCALLLGVPFLVTLASPSAADEPNANGLDMDKFAERTAARAAGILRSKKTDVEIADNLIWAIMRRKPTENEIKITAELLGSRPDREAAARDVIWALMNTKEFLKLMDFTVDDVKKINEMILTSWPKK